MRVKPIEAFYKSLQVTGRSETCPRLGVYKVIGTYQGSSCRKQALMARCQWRATTEDVYQDNFFVEVQLESFKKNADDAQFKLLNSQDLKGREIDVLAAEYDQVNKQFALRWRFIDESSEVLHNLNSRIQSGELNDFELDDSLDGIDTTNDELTDY